MAFIYWHSNSLVTHSKFRGGGNFDIYNWILLKNGSHSIDPKVPNSHMRGVYVMLINELLFVPHQTISDIHEMNSKGKEYRQEQFYFLVRYLMRPSLCLKCRGHGKFDWISKNTGHAKPVHMFERDKRYILEYRESNTIQFARPVLHASEEYCPLCYGTTVSLDARQRMFKGMKGLRDYLTSIKA